LAQPPQPPQRFTWVEGLDDLYPRDYGPYLSRSMPTTQSADDIPRPDPSFVVDFAHYPTSEEIATFLYQLESTYPELAEVMITGYSWQGRPIVGLRIGNEATGDPDRRPAMYVDGQHHAREAVSSQAVLYFLWYLLSRYGNDAFVTRVLDTRTIYAIPCVNPDGNDIFLYSDQRQRRTANPTVSDDDRDGQFDEDGRENAGYGTYEIYHYTFDAQWVAEHPNDPFAEGWQSHLLSHAFAGLFDGEGREIPQVDNDGDGRNGEDPPGGVDANRNYDSYWELGSSTPWSDIYRGPVAFSEPETRAVRDFVLARPNCFTALTFHSGSDILLHPWAWSSEAELPDRFWYEMLSRKGSQLSERNGFRGAPHAWTARGLYAAAGSTLDWLYEQGILAWAPETYAASSLSFATRITTTNTYSVGLSTGEGFNPAPEAILLTADRWLHWSLYLLAATPNVGLSKVELGTNSLRLTVANDGLLPLDIQVSAQTEQATHTTTVTNLSAAERLYTVPFQPSSLPQTVTVTLTAASPITPATGRIQEQVVKLEIEGQTVRIVEGQLEPFMALGDAFGGWFASYEWDSPDYHLGPALLHEMFLPMVQG
ncbi:MAG: hypothetical protein H5T63_02515, partial [Chloroflexi bacterium]|nr:hypothetical protein [Chloroflexota bacterium]